MTEERLREFDATWARGDIDTLMTFMTEDCVYEASVGPEPGRTYRGCQAVRQGFQEMLAHDAGCEVRGGPVLIFGDKGVTEWTYVKTEPGGRKFEVRGCDIFDFRGDQILRKNAFRKTFE